MDQIGNYRILQKLGEGGMGEVFKGVDVMLEREVAIKVLRPELSQREDVLQRFRSEAIALGRLNHANIATVYSFARDGDRYYMALEFVNGEALDKLIAKRGRLAWPDAVRYACAALEGLEHAHRLNVIHRDVKPANILIAYTGTVKIMDFGIARILERARQTRQGYLIGTLEYMSPEQIRGLEVDARSDIYSLGMVLYEMLTGRLPFQKNSEFDLLKSQIEEPPPPPRVFAPDVPQPLENIVLRALAKKPADRFNSALEFLGALHHMAGDRASVHDSPRETRLAAPGALSRPGIGRIKNRPGGGRWLRLGGELLSNYPVPAVSLLVLLLAVAGFFFLPNPTPTGDGKTKGYPEIPSVEIKKPEPPAFHGKAEDTRHEPNPQAQDTAIKKAEPPMTAPPQPVNAPAIPSQPDNLPATPAVRLPVSIPKLESPPNSGRVAPPDTARIIQKAAPMPRTQVLPKAPKNPTVKPKDSPPKAVSKPDENAEYWKDLNRNLSEKGPPKTTARPQQPKEEKKADYWDKVGREASGFLKGH